MNYRNPEILDPWLVVVKESQAEMYACWDIINFIVDSTVESALELMNCLNLNN